MFELGYQPLLQCYRLISLNPSSNVTRRLKVLSNVLDAGSCLWIVGLNQSTRDTTRRCIKIKALVGCRELNIISRISDLADEIGRLRPSVNGPHSRAQTTKSTITSDSTLPTDLLNFSQDSVLPPESRLLTVSEASLLDAPPGQPLFSSARELDQHAPLSGQMRSVGSVQIPPEDAQDLFSMYVCSFLASFEDINISRFFEHHHHFLEIIDSSITPDSCYRASPVLYWAIVIVAAQQYGKRSELLTSLSQPATDLIWKTISVLPHSRHTVKAILLISMWPFPTNSMSTDVSFMLVNMAKTASMQLRLHRPETAQDFLRVRTKLDTVQFQKAMKIWVGYYIASQWYVECALCSTNAKVQIASQQE